MSSYKITREQIRARGDEHYIHYDCESCDNNSHVPMWYVQKLLQEIDKLKEELAQNDKRPLEK